MDRPLSNARPVAPKPGAPVAAKPGALGAAKPGAAKPGVPVAAKPGAPGTPAPKKKLSLDVSDVSEVLERKISP